MANIATIFTAAVLRPGVPRGTITPHAVLRAATRHFGRSYCVPPWWYDDYPAGVVYTQHGEKWSPTGVFDVWERYGRFLAALVVRWYDDGADHDVWTTHGDAGPSPDVVCRYGFDAVRLRGSAALGERLAGDGWRRDGPDCWFAGLHGSYLAGNGRCGLSDYPSLPSRTTPVRGQPTDRGTLSWTLDDIPAAVARHESAVLAEGTRVEFLHLRRLVRVYERREGYWLRWNLDDWDNCESPAWLAARLPSERT